jgi:hypothetical protein
VVADFEGTYHAILGHPTITKFMAVPHYKYLVLKMPMEKGVLTLRGNVFVAYTCEEDNFCVAEAHDLSLRMAAMTMEYKEIQLVEDGPTKTALIGSNLDPK